MKYIVCLKQESNEINQTDKNAIETALVLKDQNREAKVVVISTGSPQAVSSLKQLLTKGVDKAILVYEDETNAADSLADSIANLGIERDDVIICGWDDTRIAQSLHLKQVSSATDITQHGTHLTIQQQAENGLATVETETPCLVSSIKTWTQPKYMTA